MSVKTPSAVQTLIHYLIIYKNPLSDCFFFYYFLKFLHFFSPFFFSLSIPKDICFKQLRSDQLIASMCMEQM